MNDNQTDSEIIEQLSELNSIVEKLTKKIEQPQIQQKHFDWQKWVATGITIVTLSIGIIGGWYTNKASVSQLQINHSELSKKVAKLDDVVHDIELKVVQDNSTLNSLQNDVREVKSDVKDIKHSLINSVR